MGAEYDRHKEMAATMLDEIEAARRRTEADYERMAAEGEPRCWLNGGIVNADEKPTVVTIYGALTEGERNAIFDLCRKIDARAALTSEDQR